MEKARASLMEIRYKIERDEVPYDPAKERLNSLKLEWNIQDVESSFTNEAFENYSLPETDACPTCHRPFTEHDDDSRLRLQAEFQASLTKATDRMSTLDHHLSLLHTEQSSTKAVVPTLSSRCNLLQNQLQQRSNIGFCGSRNDSCEGGGGGGGTPLFGRFVRFGGGWYLG